MTTAAGFSGPPQSDSLLRPRPPVFARCHPGGRFGTSDGGADHRRAGAFRCLIPTSAHVSGSRAPTGSAMRSSTTRGAPRQSPTSTSCQPGRTTRRCEEGYDRPRWPVAQLGDIVETPSAKSSASGAILVGSSQSLLVTSRTYNNATSGTYGQYVAANRLPRRSPEPPPCGSSSSPRAQTTARTSDSRTALRRASPCPWPSTVRTGASSGHGTTPCRRTATSRDRHHREGHIDGRRRRIRHRILELVERDLSRLRVGDRQPHGDPITVTPVVAASISAAPLSFGEGGSAGEPDGVAGAVTVFSDGFRGGVPGIGQSPRRRGRATHCGARAPTARRPHGERLVRGRRIRRRRSGGPYRKNMDTYLVYGPFSLADASAASVEFDLWLQSESDTTSPTG